MQNGLQLKSGKSEALIIGTTAQLHAITSAVSSVAVAGVELPVANEMKVLVVVLDRRLTFENHVTMVARSCRCQMHKLSDTYATYCQRSWHRHWRAA